MDLSAENFTAAVSGPQATLVDFWAPWCQPCRQLAPILDQVAEELNLPVHKVLIDEHQHLAGEFQVQGIPTVIVFRHGQELGRIIGVYPRAELLSSIQRLLDS